MNRARLFYLLIVAATGAVRGQPGRSPQIIHPLSLRDVVIRDRFWTPRFAVWDSVTVYDVLDKLAGHYSPDRPDLTEEKEKTGRTRNALLNFDLVAAGKKNTGAHDGPPWYDGLLYETIRGAADPDGYINTYTTLVRPDKRWGTNGGDKWQHDLYNSGMLVEAGVHYYGATGKTKLLGVAVRMTNFIYSQIGPAPKLNVIPGHGGPEEAMLKMYELFRDHPEIKKRITVTVSERDYRELAEFWIRDRGNYGDPGGGHTRNSDSSYNQDHMPVFAQPTIEGHAVRATLLATGVAERALDTGDARYAATARRYWENMAGKRMFITGGEGAIADGERFGPDYYLPESAYLETCAAIGAGFFTKRMSELEADGRYMDEFERILYNNLLSGISLDGTKYFYENPLTATDHSRWSWHSCPCCPPMILKMVSALPQYIYGQDDSSVYVNLFIGSIAKLQRGKAGKITLRQETGYPWTGETKITVDPDAAAIFSIKVRIPGWARGEENPFGLYESQVTGTVRLSVNGKPVAVNPEHGYAVIRRSWKKGDIITLGLPMTPRCIRASDSVQSVHGKLALASGPVVYAFEGIDNPGLSDYRIDSRSELQMHYQTGLLSGVNTITGTTQGVGMYATSKFTAIPFYSIGNRGSAGPYTVWLPAD